jgi:spore coat protein CotH
MLKTKLILLPVLALIITGLSLYINTYNVDLDLSSTSMLPTSTTSEYAQQLGAVSTYGPELYESLFDTSIYHEIRIEMTDKAFGGMREDMLELAKTDERMRTGNYQAANVSIRIGNQWYFIDNVGIRTKGNTTRKIPEFGGFLNKFHFKLKFDETFNLDPDDPETIRLAQRDFVGLGSLNVKWQLDQDPSYVRELVGYSLLGDAGVMTSKASLCKVVYIVDGVERNYGVYTMIEPIDKAFLTKRFGSNGNDGDLYKCLWQNYGPATLEPIKIKQSVGSKDWLRNYRPSYDLQTNIDTSQHELFLSFIEQLNTLEGQAFEDYITEFFDVDMFLRYQAMGVLIGMPDDYWAMGNNYFLYFEPGGYARFIPYDYDHGFGGGWNADPWGYKGIVNADLLQWYNLNAVYTDYKHDHPLVTKILANEKFQKMYLNYIKTYTNSEEPLFTFDYYKNAYDQAKALYGSHVINDIQRQERMKADVTMESYYFISKLRSVNKQLVEHGLLKKEDIND